MASGLRLVARFASEYEVRGAEGDETVDADLEFDGRVGIGVAEDHGIVVVGADVVELLVT